MITDTLEQSSRYLSLSPRFAAAFDYLKRLPPDIASGRHDIKGDDCFALVQSYQTKPHAQAAFEAHRKYIDIQFIQSGCETLLWAPLASLTQVTQPYVEERDITFYAMPEKVVPVHLQAGEFAVFFPQDGHAPGLEYAEAGQVRKIVIKVRV